MSELSGCEVYDETGEKLGVLVDVLPTAANDVWVVHSAAEKPVEFLIPALKTVVNEVDIAAKKITVSLPTGLKEIYAEKGK